MRSLVPLSLSLVLLLLTACNGSPTEPRVDATTTLSGRVVYAETGAPAEGARVVAHQSFPGYSEGEAFVDATGRYHVTGLGAGGFSVSVYPPGAAIGEPAFSRTIHLGAGPHLLDVEISGDRCVTISGTVTDRTTRLPVSGAVLRFGEQSAVTGGDGRYSVALGCPPPDAGGTRTLRIEHPRYQPRELQAQVPAYSTVRDIPLEPR